MEADLIVALRNHRAILVYIVCYCCIQFIGLDRSPLMWLDEATLNDAGRELAEKGQLRSAVFSDISSFKEHYYWQPPAQALLSAGVYRIAGFGIWQTRIPPVLFACGFVFLFYLLVTRVVSDAHSSLLASVALSLDPFFCYVMRGGRMDAQCLFFLALALLLVTGKIGQRPTITALGAGLCIGIAGLTHPIAIAASAAMIMIILKRWKATPIRIVWFLFGAVLPVALWLSTVSVSQSGDAFKAQFLQHGGDHIVVGSLWQRCVDEVMRYTRDYHQASFVPYLFATVLVMYTVFRVQSVRRNEKTSAMNVIDLMFIIPFAFNTVLMAKTVGFYSLYVSPSIYAMAAVLLSALPREKLSFRVMRRMFFVYIVVIGSTSIAGRWLKMFSQWTERNPQTLSQNLARCVPAGSRVYGEGSLWYAAHEVGCTLYVNDYFSNQAYEERRTRKYDSYDYLILEKNSIRNADLNACDFVSSIAITASDIVHPAVIDSLYCYDVLKVRKPSTLESSTHAQRNHATINQY